MAIYTLAPQPWLIFLDDHGLYIPNGQLAIYAAGTTTPAIVYSDANGIPHPWPITLDGTGRVPGGLYLQPGLSYKFVLHAPMIEEPLDGAIIRTQDNVGAVPISGGSILTISTPGDYSNINVSGVDVVEYTGGGDVTIRGLSGGLVGQEVVIRNRTPFTVWLYSDQVSAGLTDRLYNFFLTGPAPLVGPISMARYAYTTSGGVGWLMTEFVQGAPIRPLFNAAVYAAAAGGTWVVEQADIASEDFYIQGRTLTCNFRYDSTTTTGAPNALTRTLPYGWTALVAYGMGNMLLSVDGAATYQAGDLTVPATLTQWAIQRLPLYTPFPAIANGVTVLGQISFLLK